MKPAMYGEPSAVDLWELHHRRAQRWRRLGRALLYGAALVALASVGVQWWTPP